MAASLVVNIYKSSPAGVLFCVDIHSCVPIIEFTRQMSPISNVVLTETSAVRKQSLKHFHVSDTGRFETVAQILVWELQRDRWSSVLT